MGGARRRRFTLPLLSLALVATATLSVFLLGLRARPTDAQVREAVKAFYSTAGAGSLEIRAYSVRILERPLRPTRGRGWPYRVRIERFCK